MRFTLSTYYKEVYDALVCVYPSYCAMPSVTFAAPAPPPPPGVTELASKISDTLTPATFDQYASLFADDVKVYSNEKLLAGSKAEWLVIARKISEKWSITKIDSAIDPSSVLISETVSSIAPYRPGVISDCCYWARASRYSISSSKLINEVRFLESGSYWRSFTKAR
ncbi:hypothetical protein [Novosphingobium sp. AP12]|uniref:hypothetical protein n=1 Tax=Novosphingobium sp. AP12 TaxID=1144305 RepID=UPI0012F797CD|nr:hypothetical protein [Novosphingobium sp. AP12]